jgi:hypothetical protein
MNFAPSSPDTVDVGCLADHQSLMVDARLHPADVVAHDEQDVRLGLGLRQAPKRCQERDSGNERGD